MIAALLTDGRLHLQDGPIDLLCRAWGDAAEVRAAYGQAVEAFPAVLPALCRDLAFLRTALKPSPCGRGLGEGASAGTTLTPALSRRERESVAGSMVTACLPYAGGLITPMAAVAGAVADHVLAAMTHGRRLARAFVNNGGDIAFHLAPGHGLRCGLVTELAAPALDGLFSLTSAQLARGIATSGRACKGKGGRSFSFGIADAVTILARTAAEADAAATMVANAVDLPGHPAVERRPASEIDPDSDLGSRLITWDLGPLTRNEVAAALDAGRRVADGLFHDGLILGAVLALRGQIATLLQPVPDAA
jgi:uncharacterized protein